MSQLLKLQGEIRTPVSPEESVPTLTYYKALSHNIESKEQPAGTRTGLGTHIKRQKNEEKAFASTFYIENKHNEATPSSKIFESGNHWLQSNEILWKECLASPDCYSIIHQSSNENMYQEFLTIFEQYAEKIQPGDEISSFPSLNLILKVINFIQKHDLEKVAIINTLFLNDEPVKTLIWYTDTVLFENRGVIGLFQAFRIKKFVADHPDLKHVSALLYSLQEKQWEKIEFEFLKAHLDKRFNPQISSAAYDKLVEIFYEEIEKIENVRGTVIQISEKFNLELDYEEFINNYFKVVFVWRTLNHSKKYNSSFKIQKLCQDKMKILGDYLNSFQYTLFHYHLIKYKQIHPEHYKDLHSIHLFTQAVDKLNKIMINKRGSRLPLPEVVKVDCKIIKSFKIKNLDLFHLNVLKNKQIKPWYDGTGFVNYRQIVSTFQLL
ncbi:expressed protein [Phakopsora pachyrhizi]|uniref:Expressed protein n=1 Tax=Phakopsora pachyrhizi TaxID=170000 RepID=A0AAV0BKS9_PHAPC|nr:expressed protein [Phakopsora pachyrhizi]